MIVDQVVTYLHMTAPDQLRPAAPSPVVLQRVDAGAAELVAATHRRVGTPHHWPSAELRARDWVARLRRLDQRTWILRFGRETGGVLVLAGQPDGNVEIAVFGLVPEFVGRGHGGHALTIATRAAWNTVDADSLAPVRRVWLHTSSLDHPHALRNYCSRGFRPFWTRSNRREIGPA